MATEEFPKKELETLWAPWRVEYFEKEPRNLNFLSEAAQASDDAAHLVITRRKNAFLMMNRYPYCGRSSYGGAVSQGRGAFGAGRQ